jgi:DNA (cytosine-5)-methyltransferase 1
MITPPRPTAIDLFAGAGGMSLGFEQAGFDVVAAVEYDPVHAAVHHYNFPQTIIFPRSVIGLKGDDIFAALNAKRVINDIDVVFGGAPCQGFSLIGHRQLEDPRNQLVKEYLRIVLEVQPKYFVFENVKGLTVGRHKEILNEMVRIFESSNYSITLPWRVLNAKNYGVPQNRERVFLLGVRKGEKKLIYPNMVKDVPTCGDALADLPNADDYDTLIQSDSVIVKSWKAASNYGMEMHCLDSRAWHFGYKRKWEPLLLTSSLRTAHSEISKQRFIATKGGEVEPISRFFRLHPNGQSNTLRAGTDSARGAFTSPRPIHYLYPRCVTVREMARLHGFPDWFRFHITKWHGARQIGNAVPPPLARCVASSVMCGLSSKAKCPASVIELNSPTLLTMDMTQASRYWDIEIPISKRDRKSGSKKRKQNQIDALEKH